ncbi:hypothetical protein [Mesorhizobium sp. M0768]|uniref:hypothetical protein n=1 Tax=Mesorhizobium sp. M0768 TaxID=2956996 RepID=UPI00333A6EBA
MGDKRLQPPLPRAEQRIRVLDDDVTMDWYGWFRDLANPGVRAYLEAENSYAEQATAHLTSLKDELIIEIEWRQPCEGTSPPFEVGPFEYFQTHERGLSHPAWCRRPVTRGSAELVLDPNAIPGAEVFSKLGVFELSDDGRYVAFSFDLIGDERYEYECGKWPEVVTSGAARIASSGSSGPRRIKRFFSHGNGLTGGNTIRLSSWKSGDSDVVFEEANERLAVLVRRSDSGAWLFLNVVTTYSFSVQHGAIEVWCLPADEPRGQWRRIVKRELGHVIDAEHWGDRFLFRGHDTGPYWRLVCVPIDDPSPSSWEEIVPHRAGVTLEEVHVLERPWLF